MLDRAAQEPSSLIRMAIIVIFQASRLSTVRERTLKPFNPLLGETYELVT